MNDLENKAKLREHEKTKTTLFLGLPRGFITTIVCPLCGKRFIITEGYNCDIGIVCERCRFPYKFK